MHGPRQPVHLVTGLEADGERLSCRLCGPARRFYCGIDLRQRQPGLVEEDTASGREFDAPHAPDHKLSANLVLEIPHLPAQGRLSRVQSPFGRNRQAALLGDGDEITKMSQLHERPMPWRYGDQPTKSFSAAPAEHKYEPAETIRH